MNPKNTLDQFALLFIRKASWKWLILIVLLILPFNLVFFPVRSDKLSQLSRLKNPILDVNFSYGPEKVFSYLDAYGAQGRSLYATSELSLDLVYPILYTLLLVTLLSILLRNLSPDSRWRRLAALPVLIGLFDYGENLFLVLLLTAYPETSIGLARTASLCSSLKWSLALLTVLLILAGSVLWLARKLQPRKIQVA